VLILYLFAIVCGVLALAVRWLETSVVLALVPLFALLTLFLGIYLGKVRVYADGEAPEGLRIINAISDFTYKRRVFEVLLDTCLIALAYYGAFVLRWDGGLPDEQLQIFLRTLPLVIVIQMAFFLFGGVYRGLWRYVGLTDFITIAKAALAGATVSTVVVFVMYWFRGPSRAVALLDLLLLVVFVSLSRGSFRILKAMIVGRVDKRADATPILIYGAGDGGELLIREILNNPERQYSPVGFIDDDHQKAGKIIHGYRIFGFNELPNLIRAYGIREVLISSFKVPESKLDSLRSMGICLKKMSIRIE
jgi:UDP-GlcNAc:undecaprenyl-phosphate GlcNAc-1-phosphate transferase